MTTRNDLVDDMQGVEQILCALEGIGKEIPDKGMEPTLPALEGEVLTTGPPGESTQAL